MSYSHRTNIFDGAGKAFLLAAGLGVVGAYGLEKAGYSNKVGRVATPIIDTIGEKVYDTVVYSWRTFPELDKLKDRTYPGSDRPTWKRAP